jgi:alpha-L-fucosidase
MDGNSISATMIILQQPLIRWLLSWSTVLYDASQSTRSHIYRAQPISINSLFDSTATVNFDGQGSYYPAELLPHGLLKSENVDVSY